MSWTLSLSSAAIYKAGAGADTNATTSGFTMLTKWSDEAEASLSTLTNRDWVAEYSSVGTNFKGILDDTISSMIAKRIINYNMAGYTTRMEAQVMLDVISDEIRTNLDILKDKDATEVMF